MKSKHVVIVGAGIGGLATALRLSHRGCQVTVLEKNKVAGGRIIREQVGDCQFDGGPTLLMMLDPFRKLYKDVGEDFDKCLSVSLCDPSYRVFYPSGVRFDGTTNLSVMTDRIERLSGKADALQFPPFMAELKRLYDESIPHFVRNNYRSLRDFAAPEQLVRVVRNHMLSNLSKRVKQRFTDPRLHQLFSFQAMYLGLSPHDAPWVYATLAYMEYGEGIFYPQGGLTAITDSILELARERGVSVRLNSPVKSINGSTVTLESGEMIVADVVVANADMPYVDRELHRTPTRRKLRYSCSAHLIYLDYEGELDELEHHNVFFGGDFDGNLKALFKDHKMPEDPAFYACISKKSDPAVAPDGHLNLMILVPVPNMDCKHSKADTEKLENEVFDRLVSEVKFDRSKVKGIKRRGPSEWNSEFNLDKGAAFGISHDLFQSAFMRPQNRSKTNPNLYFVGASTVPGNGLPMVLISAELVEQRLVEDVGI